MTLTAVFILAWVAIVIAILVFQLVALFDVINKPGWAFEQAGTSKNSWLMGLFAGVFICGFIGLVVGINWYRNKRPAVVQAHLSA